MPGLVGGFGNNNSSKLKINYNNIFIYISNVLSTNLNFFNIKNSLDMNDPLKIILNITNKNKESKEKYLNSQFRSYLAGLIEGDGTFAVHDKKSTAKKYTPRILVVFKKADLPLAEYLRDITQCGNIISKNNSGYIL